MTGFDFYSLGRVLAPGLKPGPRGCPSPGQGIRLQEWWEAAGRWTQCDQTRGDLGIIEAELTRPWERVGGLGWQMRGETSLFAPSGHGAPPVAAWPSSGVSSLQQQGLASE